MERGEGLASAPTARTTLCEQNLVFVLSFGIQEDAVSIHFQLKQVLSRFEQESAALKAHSHQASA